MEQPDWMSRVGTGIAREIRRHRLARGMSAQQLSDACEELGTPIPRTVISNIENGRRTNISVAETVALAQALGVPPIALIIPAGYVEEVEHLPNRWIDPIRAVNWFSGVITIHRRSSLDGLPKDEWALTVARTHRWLENLISGIYKDINEDAKGLWEMSAVDAESQKERAYHLKLELKGLREEMVRRGLTPPRTYLQVDDLEVPADSEKASSYWTYKAEIPPF
ncbi:helix-turn-helix domain-containing protein [Streptomyces canus]|uniref:helix-turn-helix domain-containing protein n=1 Tax=Streptomyces canus TaxID=58343 RepID=UPI0027D8E9B5|nr:helix-turn-helix transcriptional regulator [Streptomyces canus]